MQIMLMLMPQISKVSTMVRALDQHTPLLPLYHPTSVMLVDEDAGELNRTMAGLGDQFTCLPFRSLDEATAHLRAWAGMGLDPAAAGSAPEGSYEYITGGRERDLHHAASRLPRVFGDAARFATPSVLVSRRRCPKSLEQAPLRHIVLADATQGEPLANQLIRMQHDYFRELTNELAPVLATAEARFLTEPALRQTFLSFAARHSIIEYCAALSPPGLLGLDEDGRAHLLVLVDADYRQAAFEIAHAEGAPSSLLMHLAGGDKLAIFPTATGFFSGSLDEDWRAFAPCCTAVEGTDYLAADISNNDITGQVAGSVVSLSSFRRRWLC